MVIFFHFSLVSGGTDGCHVFCFSAYYFNTCLDSLSQFRKRVFI